MDIITIYQTKRYGRVHKVFAGYVAVPTIGNPSFHHSMIAALVALSFSRKDSPLKPLKPRKEEI